ncbi:hypothetical protein B4U80_14423, partial [Leptotrombidium deliense]
TGSLLEGTLTPPHSWVVWSRDRLGHLVLVLCCWDTNTPWSFSEGFRSGVYHLHLFNILLKKKYTSLDDRILIIDYEMIRYYYRGYDLACFIAAKNLEYLMSEDNRLSVEQAPIDSKMRDLLLVEYLNEYKKLSVEYDENYDNFEHLSMEVDVFGLVFDVSFISWVKAATIAQTTSYGLPLVRTFLTSF